MLFIQDIIAINRKVFAKELPLNEQCGFINPDI